jgi:site-specific recombinase XerD
MATKAGGGQGGWKLKRKPGRHVWNVVYRTPAGRTGERSTGTSDDAQARIEGARIFGEEVLSDAKGVPSRDSRKRTKPEQGSLLTVLFGNWLTWLRATHAAQTIEIWELYSAKWIVWFGGELATERDVTTEKLKAFIAKRLTEVRATSVKKERAALVNFLNWLESEGYELAGGLTVSDLVPRLPKRAAGTAYGKRRRVAAPALAPEHVRAVIKALPEWSSDQNGAERFAVRARFLVQYETGLRPSLFDRIRVPEHYEAGSRILRITPDIDKARYGRDVPLTKRARRVLDYVIGKLDALNKAAGRPPHVGLVFGPHDYRKHIARAAKRALPRELAGIFCGAHLRSARITHLLEIGANIPGVQQLVGHKQMSTTAKYVKPSFRAAEDALNKLK